ncbi:MAG: RHS repeat-associated core domain-containing protein [Bacteroidota bacterium]
MKNKTLKSRSGGHTIFSGALNNLNYLSGGVDPQTGLFSSVITFGTLFGNRSFGPEFPLKMSFSPLGTLGENSSYDTLLGKGWDFELPSYNGSADLITLPGGKTYKVYSSNWSGESSPWRISHKADDVQIFGKEGAFDSKEITIRLKSGEEFLLYCPDQYSGRVQRYTAPDGRYLEFEMSSVAGGDRLDAITDSSGDTLVAIDYEADNETGITLYPGSPSERGFTLFTNGRNNTLSRFTLSLADGEDLSTEFEYEHKTIQGEADMEMSSINKIMYPSGAEENVVYDNRIYLPPDAPWNNVPAVSRHSIQHYSSGEVKETEYILDEDGNNFFGKNIGSLDWEDATDSLANHDGAYTYTNTVVEGGIKQTSYTYNKFHQLTTTEETYDGGTTKKVTTMTYYGDESLPLDDDSQHILYELEKERKVRYEDSEGNSREFITEYDHDPYGNLLTQKNPDGTVEVNSYYEAAGSGTDCPAHPFGMEAFIKQSIQHPAVDGAVAADPKQLDYTHKAIAKKHIADGAVETFVVPATETFAGTLTTFNYHDEALEAEHHGMIKEKIAGPEDSQTTHSYDYDVDAGAATLTVTETITGHDETQSSTSETKAYGHDQVVEAVDEDQVTTRYVYDAIGRVTQELHAPDTDYKSTTSWRYQSLSGLSDEEKDEGVGTIGWVIRESNSTSAAETRTYYTHGKKEFTKYIKADNASFYNVSQIDYDALERELRTARFDHELHDDGTMTTHEQFKASVYGIWGEVRETTDFNGAVTTTEVNPFTLQSTQYTQHPGNANYFAYPQRSTYTLFKETDRVEILDGFEQDSAVYAVNQYTYDGFGRKVSQTSPTGKTVQTRYDDFDRPVTITHHDQTVTVVEYDAPSEDEAVKSVSVGDGQNPVVEIGAKTYDGLGRLHTKTVNGATWNYEYDSAQGSATKAWRVTNARGQSLLFGFVPEIDALSQNATAAIQGADWASEKALESHFTFATGTTADAAHPLGSLTEASGDHGNYSYTYTPTGKVQSVTQHVEGKPSVTLDYTRTLLGKPLRIAVTKDGVDSGEIVMTYDAYGRLKTTTQQGITSEYGFDPLGRIQTLSVYNEGGDIATAFQTTEIVYNKLNGKEEKRTVTVANQVTVLDYVYYPDTLLEQRTTTLTGATNGTLTETFTYDDKGRLHVYEATGDESLLPRNEHNRPFVGQELIHNAFDNLESLTTTFPNGDENTATYHYNGTRLETINNSFADGTDNAYAATVSLTYDADGNLETLTSAAGDGTVIETTAFAYNAYNKVADINGSAYTYDCFNRLLSSGDTVYYYEENNKLTEHTSDGWSDFLRHGAIPVAENGKEGLKFLATDAGNTVFGVMLNGTVQHTTFSPQGVGVNNARTGFNGEYSDPHIGGYHLGHGNRLYMPHLGVFNSMDSKSPFSIGGINPYRYCGGDPVNFSDPTGEFAFLAFLISAIIGVAISAAAEGTRAIIAHDKFNWKGFLVDSVLTVATAGVGTALTSTKAGIKITRTATKALSAAIKSNRVTANAAKGVKKGIGSVKKGFRKGKNKITGKHEAKISGKNAEGPSKYKQLDFDQDPAILDKHYEGRRWAQENFGKKPGAGERFYDKTGYEETMFSIASKTFTLGNAVREGFRDRNANAEEETGDTQLTPVFSGDAFYAFYNDEA